MAHKRKGQLTTSPEWARHLRKFMKRRYWHKERLAERELIRKEEAVRGHDVDEAPHRRSTEKEL